MMSSESVRLERERRRILAAYERRRERGGPAFFGHEDPAHVLRLHQRYRETLRLLRTASICVDGDPASLRALDVGCGDGTGLLELLQWGFAAPDLAGIDTVFCNHAGK